MHVATRINPRVYNFRNLTLSVNDSKFSARLFLICLFLSMKLYSKPSLNWFASSDVSYIYDLFWFINSVMKQITDEFSEKSYEQDDYILLPGFF